MHAPLDGGVAEDHGCAGEMGWTGDNFGGAPAVGSHDLPGIAGVLDGVLCAGLDEEGGLRNALGVRSLGHDGGFHELVVGGTAGEDEARSDAALIFMHRFSDAGELCGGGVAVVVGGSAEDNDGVEAGEGGVGLRLDLAGDDAPPEQDDAESRGGEGGAQGPIGARGCGAAPACRGLASGGLAAKLPGRRGAGRDSAQLGGFLQVPL